MKGLYILSLVPGSVGISSIIYWIYPDYSWRRYFDMAIVQIGLWFQIIYALQYDHCIYYYLIKALSILSFGIGIEYYKQGDYKLSTFFHCALHVVANIANIYLYHQI
jgi:hypothetical protein